MNGHTSTKSLRPANNKCGTSNRTCLYSRGDTRDSIDNITFSLHLALNRWTSKKVPYKV